MYSKGIIGTHLYLPIDELQTPINKLRSKLTARPKYAELAPIPMFDESREGYFGIPRYYGIKFSTINDLTWEVAEGTPIEPVFTSELWDNQVPVHAKFIEALNRGGTGFIIKARTGFGKTILMLKILTELKRNALIVVPTTGLLTQWREMIVKHTSYSEKDIGHVQANILDYKNKPISIGLIQTLCKDKYSTEFNNYFGVVCYDEIQRTAAEHFSKAITILGARYRIGASATLSRQDNMDVVFRNHIGENLISMGGERDEEVRPKILILRYIGARKSVPGWTAKLSKIKRRGVILSALAEDTNRTDIIFDNVIKLAMSGRRVLVLSDRISQLSYLFRRTDISHQPGLFISTTPEKSKPDILNNCGIIYATTGMFSIGMDIPDLAGLVFATPQSRVRQSVGRITRLCKGKKRPVVVDIVDNDISDCRAWYNNRLKEYKHDDIKGDIIVL